MTRVQILGETFCISYSTNTVEKDAHLSLLGLFNLGMASGIGKIKV